MTADSAVNIYKRYEVVNGSAPSETFEFEVKFAEKFDTDTAAKMQLILMLALMARRKLHLQAL